MFLSQDLSYHLFNKLGNLVSHMQKTEDGQHDLWAFPGELDCKGTMVQCGISGGFLAWPHNPTGLTTLLLLYVMKLVYLLTYS